MRELEEVILEIVEVPEDRAAVEGRMRMRDRVVDHRVALHLEPRQDLQHAPVDGDRRLGEASALPHAGLLEEVEERRLAEVLLEPDAGGFVDGMNLRHG